MPWRHQRYLPLTTGVDTIVGGAGADTFAASVVFDASEAVTSASTMTAADEISGGAGIDKLNITISGAQDAGVALPAALTTGVEVFNIRNTVAQTLSLDASNYAGLTNLNADRSVGAVTVTNLAAGASAAMIGNATVTNGALSAGYVAAATSATVNIADGTKAGAITLSGTGLTSATVNSTGASNIVGALTLAATTTTLTVDAATKLTTGAVTNTTSAALKTLNIKGAGAVNLSATALESTVTKIDASANTGGLTATLNTNATQVVIGSSGDDVFTIGAVTLTTGSVNAGLGNDTLVIGSNVGNVNTVALGAKYTGFETLAVTGTLDASLISGITAIRLGDTSTISGLNATQASAISTTADITASTTLALTNATGSNDALTLTLGQGGSGTGAAFDVAGALVVTGFETLNLVANGGATASAGANRTVALDTAITGSTLTKINLTGTAFDFTDIATTKAVTINGAALTGDGDTAPLGLTVAGSAVVGSSITGSAFGDRFTIAAAGSTYNGLAGNDIFTTTAALLAADGTDDTTIVGGAGNDLLNITSTLTLTDNNFTNVTGMEGLGTSATTAVSYTGLGAAFKAAYADGVAITSGTLANGATYTLGAGLYDKSVKLTLVSSGDGASSADNISITTGSGADTVSVIASSWVGAAGTAGVLAVSTGAGNDTISVTTGTLLAVTGANAVVITGGTGADVITSVGANAATGLGVAYKIAAGDSLTTAYDSITGFDMADGTLVSSLLDFDSVSIAAYAATAATGFSASELTVAVATSTGLVTFAGTSAASLTLAQKIAAVQSVVTTTSGNSALFTNTAGGVTSSYVFNNNSTSDSLVELVGITGTALGTTASAVTANLILIG